MTVQQLIEFYKTGYQFEKATGISSTSYQNWLKWGYIPIVSQFKIEEASLAKLRADIKHAKRSK